jgi:HSP20 family protein
LDEYALICLSGVKKEEVKVEVEDNNVLRLSGQRVKEEEQKGDTWHRVERSRGSFQRRFRLPDTADLDNIKCALENGVLTVEVPKKETDKPRNVRSIDIS